MATKIHSYYLQAGELGGIEARAKLSMLTNVNSFQAASIPDTDENIQLFEKAMKSIVKEFNKESSSLEALRLKVMQLIVGKKSV
jgi:hypothetical protein